MEPAADHRADFRWTVRVYYEDTDAAGIVYYANYLKYFERCRTEWLRRLGFDQRDMAERERLQFVVADLAVQYHRPARLDDSLDIDATLVERARSYVVFRQQARRGAELLASARVKVACVDTGRLAPARMPALLLERMAASSAPSLA